MIRDLKVEDCRRLLQRHYLGYLAFIGHNSPYVLPITYFYNKKENFIISISSEGHKMDCLREDGQVSLNVCAIESLNEWTSVLVHGEFEELRGIDAKYQLHQFVNGIRGIVAPDNSLELKSIGDFSSSIKEDAISVVYKINIKEIVGKRRVPEAGPLP